MELTIDQALQRGLTAHKAGKLQEAERFYRAILQSHPTHPHANHNLGVLAVSLGKPLEAIPLFKLALETNPQIEQFWLSYIDVLIKTEQVGAARKVLIAGHQAGISVDKLADFYQKIGEAQPTDTNKTERGQPPSEKRERQFERKRSRKRRAGGTSTDAQPSQAQINGILEHYRADRLTEAEKLAVSLTKHFPGHPFAWMILGVVFQQTGRPRESLMPLQKAVTLSPHDADIHTNLGNTFLELGKLDQAEASHRRAITLNPDLAVAHYNLGNVLSESGRLRMAQASYEKAITLKPDFAAAYSNLGNTLVQHGELMEAISAHSQAIKLSPDSIDFLANLGSALNGMVFTAPNRKLYPNLLKLLTTENIVRPADITASILSLLKHDPLITRLLTDQQALKDFTGVINAIEILDKFPVLHHLMRLSALTDLDFEELFRAMRKTLLVNVDKNNATPVLINFLSTLSLHCFINEYIYSQTDEEARLIKQLESKIAKAVLLRQQPELCELLCLASYHPLIQYDWSRNPHLLDQEPEIQLRQIDEPLAERVIAQQIPALGEISHDISQKVREQYEQNPYPRWIRTKVASKGRPVGKVCDELKLSLHHDGIKEVLNPEILIAGCGTGQHSISTASRFSNCNVTAVDLSLASLAYAKRKTIELGIDNIIYLQSDILALHQLKKEFDVVECCGVLHHMEDPMDGWRVLTDLLKRGGLMKVALYSELARRNIVKARKTIELSTVRATEAEIIEFRRAVGNSSNEDYRQIAKFGDFFSLSGARDLLFNVQEHRFSISQIQECISQLGLKFCGFEDRHAITSFRQFFDDDSDAYDLNLWDQLEHQKPDIFAGMYQFWCQKS